MDTVLSNMVMPEKPWAVITGSNSISVDDSVKSKNVAFNKAGTDTKINSIDMNFFMVEI